MEITNTNPLDLQRSIKIVILVVEENTPEDCKDTIFINKSKNTMLQLTMGRLSIGQENYKLKSTPKHAMQRGRIRKNYYPDMLFSLNNLFANSSPIALTSSRCLLISLVFSLDGSCWTAASNA